MRALGQQAGLGRMGVWPSRAVAAAPPAPEPRVPSAQTGQRGGRGHSCPQRGGRGARVCSRGQWSTLPSPPLRSPCGVRARGRSHPVDSRPVQGTHCPWRLPRQQGTAGPAACRRRQSLGPHRGPIPWTAGPRDRGTEDACARPQGARLGTRSSSRRPSLARAGGGGPPSLHGETGSGRGWSAA